MNMHAAMDPVSELKAMVAMPFESATAIPKSAYTSDAFLDRELSEVFCKEWVCVGRADQLAKPGDYLTYELAGEPVLVVRDQDGQLRAMSNVCLHRMSTIMHGSGNSATLTCPYHGWVYSLDGSLRGAPGMGQNTGFKREEYCLPEVRCVDWQGFIMISLNADAPDPATHYAEVTDMVGDFDMSAYTSLFHETHVWNTNWKVLAENFMESYHLPVCHAGTVGGVSKLEEMDCPPGLADLQLSLHSQGCRLQTGGRTSGQHAATGRLAANDHPAGDLPKPAGDADARLFLVSQPASQGRGSCAHHLWRGDEPGLHGGPGGRGFVQ